MNSDDFIGGKNNPISEYIKNQPPYVLELQDNTHGIHSSWMDQSYRDKNNNGEFNNCVMGLMPSMVLAPKIQYKYNNKIYDQIDCVFSCPGTGASLMIFRRPYDNPYNDPKNWSLTGEAYTEYNK